MIIDFEHHYTPIETWTKRGGKKGQVVRTFSPEGKEIRPLYDADHDIELHLKYMDIAGIDMAVLSKNLDDLEEAKLFNESCSKVVRQYPQRLIGFASTLPLRGKLLAARSYLRAARSAGSSLIQVKVLQQKHRQPVQAGWLQAAW